MMNAAASFMRRVRRHWRWGKEQGLGRLIEEDELNPIPRFVNGYRKWQWRRRNGGRSGPATAIFVVGAQRSGTNMLVRGLQTSPEFEVYNENNRRAFSNYHLLPDGEIAQIIESSRHPYILFKPLIDSHRIDQLLDHLPVATRPRALWAYRNMDGRVRSAMAKFGDSNLRALKDISDGRAGHRWEAGRLSPRSIDLIQSFNYDNMSPASGSALFWYVRNMLFFELRLNERPDVLLVSYDSFLVHPQESMRLVCEHIGFEWNPDLSAHINSRGQKAKSQLDIDPTIRQQCEKLQYRLACEESRQRNELLARARKS